MKFLKFAKFFLQIGRFVLKILKRKKRSNLDDDRAGLAVLQKDLSDINLVLFTVSTDMP